MEVFNNREVAIITWIAILVIYLSLQHKIRLSIINLIKALSNKHIIILLSLMLLYIFSITFFLYKIGLWKLAELKTTIIWIVSVASVSLVRIDKAAEKPLYFLNLVMDQIKLIVFFEFVVSFYTFNLLTELFFVPLAAMIGVMLAVSQMNDNLKLIEKLLNILLFMFGLALIINSTYYLVSDFQSFAEPETFLDFSLPPLLTSLFLPFLYVIFIITNYEYEYRRLSIFLKKHHYIIRYAKTMSILKFNIRISLLKRWITSLAFINVATKKDVSNSINKILRMRVEEKHPPYVPISKGWSPYLAKDFLISKGIKTGYYQPTVSDQCYASSPIIKLNDGIIPNDITYYIDGDISTVKKLQLVLNVNTLETAIFAHEIFLEYTKLLFQRALKEDIPQEIEAAILIGDDKNTVIKGKRVIISQKKWLNNGSYDINFVIQHI